MSANAIVAASSALNSVVPSISNTPAIKIKAIYKNSLGNTHKLAQQIKQGSESKLKREMCKARVALNSAEAIAVISKLSGCCSTGGSSGCLLMIFSNSDDVVDFNSAVSHLLECREITRNKTEEEKYTFLQELFRKSIESVIEKANGKKEYKMNYQLRGKRVCKKAIAEAFGYSVKSLEKCSSALKGAPNGSVFSTKVKTFSDAHIPDYTFAETAEIFRKNLPSEIVGE
jgi:hypothetical protein